MAPKAAPEDPDAKNPYWETRNGKRVTLGIFLFLWVVVPVLSMLYYQEVQKRSDMVIAMQVIRGFVVGIDPFFEEKSDAEVLIAAQNASQELVEIVSLNEELQKVIDDIQDNMVAGWKLYNRNLYFFSTDLETWPDAKTQCVRLGASLVSIETEEEKEFINGHVNKLKQSYWIALYKDSNGNWEWLGEMQAALYYWGTGEPAQVKGPACAVTSYSCQNYCWKALSCFSKEHSCCKQSPEDRWL